MILYVSIIRQLFGLDKNGDEVIFHEENDWFYLFYSMILALGTRLCGRKPLGFAAEALWDLVVGPFEEC